MTDDFVARGKAVFESGKYRHLLKPDTFGVDGAEGEISTEPPFDPGTPPPLYLVDDDDEELPDLEEPSDDDDHHVGEWLAPDAEALIARRLDWLRINAEARRRLDDEQHPPAPLPPVKSLDTLLAEPDTPAQFRIADVAPVDSRIILSAQYKAGKTIIVNNVLRSLADSDPFLGRFAVNSPAAGIVLIDDELSENMLRRWLRDQRIVNTGAVVDVISLRGRISALDLLNDRCRREWVQRLADLGCDYLLLDCLRPVLDALGLDEHHDAGKFLVQFDALMADAGIRDAMLIHHMGHNGEHARGDSRLEDWPDAIWRIHREKPDDPSSPRFFSAVGRDVSVAEGRLSYDPATRRLTYAPGSRNDAKTEAAYIAVISVLAADAKEGGEGKSKNAIENDTPGDHPRQAIRDALAKAVEQGRVHAWKGKRNAQMRRIAHPCSACGLPIIEPDRTYHIACPAGPEVSEGLF